MPQPPPIRVSNGTTTLWVMSMTESTTPPAPQYTLKSAARRTVGSIQSKLRNGPLIWIYGMIC